MRAHGPGRSVSCSRARKKRTLRTRRWCLNPCVLVGPEKSPCRGGMACAAPCIVAVLIYVQQLFPTKCNFFFLDMIRRFAQSCSMQENDRNNSRKQPNRRARFSPSTKGIRLLPEQIEWVNSEIAKDPEETY